MGLIARFAMPGRDISVAQRPQQALLARWLLLITGLQDHVADSRDVPSFIASDHATRIDSPGSAPGVRALASASGFAALGATGFVVYAVNSGFAPLPLLVAAGFGVLFMAALQLELFCVRHAAERYAGCLHAEARLRRQVAPEGQALIGQLRRSAINTTRLVRMRAAGGYTTLCLAALALGGSANLWGSFLVASLFWAVLEVALNKLASRQTNVSILNGIAAVLAQPKASPVWDAEH